MIDPYSGKFLSTEYMPGQQNIGFSIVTSFFALHFGSFGGVPVQWGYVLLGLSGAYLFYIGNHLWIIARQRREKREGLENGSLATQLLERFTYSLMYGYIGSISSLFVTNILYNSVTIYILTIQYCFVMAVFITIGITLPKKYVRSLCQLMAGFLTVLILFSALLLSSVSTASLIEVIVIMCSILLGSTLIVVSKSKI